MENSKDLGFVLIRKDDGTYIKLENVTIELDVLDEYFQIAGVKNYDSESLRMAISNNKQTTLRFSRDVIDEFNEFMKVIVSNDKLEAKVKFYPPIESGRYLTAKEMRDQL